jgi:AcrR family transcriptional regulator
MEVMKNVTSNNDTPVRAKRRPGRPGPQSLEKDQMRDRILDGSEQLFSESGYAATSFRDIARLVQVNPALIGYYFGSKRMLFNEVYKRRGKELTDRWMLRLDAAETAADGAPSVEQILRAFLEPQFELKTDIQGGMAFIRLQTRVHSEVSEENFALRREVYDEAGKRFIALLERALPDVDPADVNSRFIFCIGSSLYMIAEVDRLSDLSSGRFDSTETQEVIERLTRFCVAGMLAQPTFFGKKKTSKNPKSKVKGSSARASGKAGTRGDGR